MERILKSLPASPRDKEKIAEGVSISGKSKFEEPTVELPKLSPISGYMTKDQLDSMLKS
jgi:hypothetical protein